MLDIAIVATLGARVSRLNVGCTLSTHAGQQPVGRVLRTHAHQGRVPHLRTQNKTRGRKAPNLRHPRSEVGKKPGQLA